MLPRYIPQDKRSEFSQRWHAAKAAKRLMRGPDEETLRWRALHDARGQVIREGHTYRSTGIVHWQVRRAVSGRTNQFEFVANGSVKLLSGPRRFPRWARPSLEFDDTLTLP